MIAGTAVLGLVSSALGLGVLAAEMVGVPLGSIDLASIEMILTGTAVGAAWAVRVGALLLALGLALFARDRPILLLAGVTLAGAAALASLAWGGHGAMDEGSAGWLHLCADVAHLVAAGAWVGALLALLLLVFRRPEYIDRDHLILTHRALAGFAGIGTILVATIIASGLINGWMVVGATNVLRLPASLYGQLLIAKLVLFGAMLALAAGNRFRLVPKFEDALASGGDGAALAALRRSLLLETGCAVVVLGLVAWLGTLQPPITLM